MSVPEGLDFGSVAVVVCEPNVPLRQNIRQLLRRMGFGDIVCKEKWDECVPLLARGPVDLLICDDLGDGDASIELVHGIRHQAIDNNPFVVTFSLIDQQFSSKGTVMRAVNVGSDVLIAKPFTSGAFVDHVAKISKFRKSFVVTADYIGPTRRDARNDRERKMEFAVPNPVKEIASGTARDALAARIREAAESVNQRKLHRNVEEIALRAGEVREALAKGMDGKIVEKHVASLRAATTDIQRRVANKESKHVSELCSLIFLVADRVEDARFRDNSRNLAAIDAIIKGLKITFGIKD